MLHRGKILLPGLALILVLSAQAIAQAPSLQEQLTAQYKVTKMGSDSSGASVVDAGTLLAIQKGGILGVPWTDHTMLTTKYEGGTVHSPSNLMVAGKKFGLGRFSQTQNEGQTTKFFAKNDKIYLTKLDVNLDKDTVNFAIVACDTCNKVDPPTYNKANVQFVFPHGTLAKASAGDVEDTIGQLLSISDDSQQSNDQQQDNNQQQGNNQQGNNQQQGGGNQQQGGGQDQGGGGDPQNIQMGMSPDQVQGALGQPQKTVNLGPKQIWVYKDLKVTFFNGKVVDVQ
jgi:hypothetical protein